MLKPRTLGDLKQTEWGDEARHLRSVKDEMRENLICLIEAGAVIFPGIIGFEETVVPQVINAVVNQSTATDPTFRPTELGYPAGLTDPTKFNPLTDWTQGDVWHYIASHGVDYNPLHDQFYPSIGCAPCTRAVSLGEDFRAGRWWWEQESAKECGLHVKIEERVSA